MERTDSVSRRQAMLAAGAVSIGVIGLSTTTAEASNFPKLDKALAEMESAKAFLKDANNRFGGHKKKAIDALTTAISEIEAAIKFAEDKK